jgi:taurine--2-oxoglutarate transaminase
MLTTENLQALHARTVLTPWSAQGGLTPPVIVRGEGSYIEDDTGKRYLDLASGLVAVNLGHGHPAVVKAIQDQAARLCYAAPSLFNDERALLAQSLVEMSPWSEGARVFFTPSGTEANEDAVKLTRMLTGRHKILASYRSYHGSTHGSSALTGEDRRWAAEPGIPGVVHFFAPYPYRSPFYTQDPAEETRRALEHLERTLLHEDPNRVAAVILEPVVGSNGVIVYPEGYLQGVRAITEQHGILLVFDEVMTGFGRVGAPFAAQRFGVTPDLITFAKGVTSAYVPLGGVILREGLASTFDERVMWVGHTYSGHPLSVAAGRAAVQAYKDDAVFERARELEGWLSEGLGRLTKNPLVGEVRGLGGFFALELVKDQSTREEFVPWHGAGLGPLKAFYGDLRARGVYTFGKFNCVMVTPPLTISRQDLDFGLEALEGALEKLAASV